MQLTKNFPTSVLIIDDDEFSREILHRMFQEWGVPIIHTINDGIHAVPYLTCHPTELIVTDIFMEYMDGISLINELIEIKYTGRIVFISGESPAFLEVAAMVSAHKNLKIVAALVKPVPRDKLFRAIS